MRTKSLSGGQRSAENPLQERRGRPAGWPEPTSGCREPLLPAEQPVTLGSLPAKSHGISGARQFTLRENACARNGVSCRREVPFLHAHAVGLTAISSPSTPPPKLQTAGQGQPSATERQGRADSLVFASRPLAGIDTFFLRQPSTGFKVCGCCPRKWHRFVDRIWVADVKQYVTWHRSEFVVGMMNHARRPPCHNARSSASSTSSVRR